MLTRVARDWYIYASAPTRVHSASFRARSVLPTHLSTNLVSPARPNELRSRKTFGVCRTRIPPCVCIDGPFRPHFTHARAKGKRSFRTDRQCLASFRAFGAIGVENLRSQLICQISQLIFDWSHVNALHDVPAKNCVPACKVIDLRTLDRLCVVGQSTESVDKGIGEWKVRMQFSVSISRSRVWGWTVKSRSTLGSPCVAVFISTDLLPNYGPGTSRRYSKPVTTGYTVISNSQTRNFLRSSDLAEAKIYLFAALVIFDMPCIDHFFRSFCSQVGMAMVLVGFFEVFISGRLELLYRDFDKVSNGLDLSKAGWTF